MKYRIDKIFARKSRVILITQQKVVLVKGNDFELNLYEEFHEMFDSFDIDELSLGVNHLFFKTKTEEVYCLGNNDHGELGLGREEFNTSNTPTKHSMFNGKNVKKLALGDRHTMILLHDGTLYSFGDNSFGQCSGFETKIYNPTKVTNMKIVDVYAGAYHNFFINDIGEVFSWGDNSYDKLGYSLGNSVQNIPKQVPYFCGCYVGLISLSDNQSIIVTVKRQDSITQDWYSSNRLTK